MEHGILRATRDLSEQGIRVRYQPYLIIKRDAQVLMIKLRQTTNKARIQMKLRLVNQNERILRSGIPYTEISKKDLLLASAQFIQVVDGTRCRPNWKCQGAVNGRG
jgi:hypothetical protein